MRPPPPPPPTLPAATAPRTFRYPSDLPRTLRRADRLRRLLFWPLFAAPVLIFTIVAAPSLALYILAPLAAFIVLCEHHLSRRHVDSALLALSTLELRGRALAHLSPSGDVIGQLDLDAPIKVHISTTAAGNFTVTAANPGRPHIAFTSHLPGAREILEDLLNHPYPGDGFG